MSSEKCICDWDKRQFCGCFRSGVCDKPRPEHADTPTDSQPSGEHPHNDGLDEYRQPVHVGELDPAQRLALARGELK